jgi:hypothetical protein
MATTNVTLDTAYQRIVTLGDEFLLTLPFATRQDVEVAIGDFTSYGDAYQGEVADLTALEAVEAPTDGDVYLVQALRTFYAWDADGGEEETGAWVAGSTIDTVVGVQGHRLRGDRTESMNRALLGPGMVFARSVGASAPIVLTAWTPS